MRPSLSAATTQTCTPEPRCALRTVRTIAELRSELAPGRAAGATIGLVPTMGALHQGHLSLIEAARLRCDFVVVTLFVNPTQFDEQSDLLAYPRDEEQDAALAARAGADLLFAPSPDEIYKRGFASSVEVRGLTDRLEGAMRGKDHFRGVTTVVCKLLNIARPDIAYFGQKDAQQAAVIRRMVIDLDMEVQIETMPIVREPDGLAMSSRNVRLSETEREQALALYAALCAAQRLAAAVERSAGRLIEEAQRTLASYGVRPEYVALVDPESFEELDRVDAVGLMLIAARVGQTRLIDNLALWATDQSISIKEP
ncbi:MAG: pantoate--beta-alanine ligase [Solirubrobacteraceae bacterium]